MKKFLCTVLTTLLLAAMLAGCGSKKTDTGYTPEQVKINEKLVLSTEGDTLNAQMLLNLLQTPDSGVTELLGEENSSPKYGADGEMTSRTYTGVLFAQNISFQVSYDEYHDVSAIDVTFGGDASQEQLAETITNQFQVTAENNTWNVENGTLTLKDSKTLLVAPYQIADEAEQSPAA